MLNKILATICLLVVTGTCLAQSDLVFFDADGSRAGTLVQFLEDSVCDGHNPTNNPLVSCDAIVRQDTSLIKVNLVSGEISYTGLFYALDNCVGQFYVPTGPRGGVLLSKGDPDTPVLLKIDWNPEFTNITVKSRFDNNGTCSQTSGTQPLTIPAIVDPATYGMKVISVGDFKGIGFKGPLTPVTQKPDGMFCNGFEGCPTE